MGWAPIAIVTALLLTLAALQYRWIGEVSRLERLRLEDAVADAMFDLSDAVDLEVSRMATTFLLPDLDAVPDAVAAWRSESEDPELLAEVLAWWPAADRLERFDPATGTFAPAEWPADLHSALPRMRSPGGTIQRSPAGVPAPLPEGPTFTLPSPPAILLPVASGPPGDPRRRSLRARRQRDAGARLVLLLDATHLRDTLLPRLVDEHFGGAAALPVDVTVLAPGPEGERVEFSTLDEPSSLVADSSYVVPLLRIRYFPELRSARRLDRGGVAPRAVAPPNRRRPTTGAPQEGGGWLLVVDAAAGSLDATVSRLRWRNLTISAAILVVLAASLALVLGAARRRQELAHRQLALVAGITHELHTPLAALQAAAQNLEDGVVREPQRIREYGALVRREGGRLQKLVDQTLALAGMRAGDQAIRPESVSLDGAIDRAIADTKRSAPELTASFEVGIASGSGGAPPSARVDPDALQRILVNLLGNALKYGQSKVWIGARQLGAKVVVTVVDDGPGVEPSERAVLFEPFHRGRRALERTAPGSGLGLYLARRLAEAMGGSLDLVESTDAGAPPELCGAAFRLVLPAEADS